MGSLPFWGVCNEVGKLSEFCFYLLNVENACLSFRFKFITCLMIAELVCSNMLLSFNTLG